MANSKLKCKHCKKYFPRDTLIVSHKGKVADLWPSTGKFNIRGDKRYFRGVRLLIKILRGDYTDEQFKSLRAD